jgi:hypothetical protein
LSRNYGAKIQASYTYVEAGEFGVFNNNADNPQAMPGDEGLIRVILTLSF